MKTGNDLPRRRFLSIIGILSAVTASGWALVPKKPRVKTVKMLTQDGKLVEVDERLIEKKRRISDKELENWINNRD